ncbi:helix-turn-helix transcriptional regulator [Thalassospira lucentensis]|uniref:helix-turn-helix transcriptional regulator n=1 Tax=Thalassospira lucentensis TaxID=168935 RepID=UPI003D2CCFDF
MVQGVFLSDKQLATRYNVARSTVWRWVQTRNFPKPVKLGKGCSRWRISDLEKWENWAIGDVA